MRWKRENRATGEWQSKFFGLVSSLRQIGRQAPDGPDAEGASLLASLNNARSRQ